VGAAEKERFHVTSIQSGALRAFALILALVAFPSHARTEEPVGGAGLFVDDAVARVELSGYTRPARAMTIGSEAGGRLVEVNYDVGDIAGSRPFARVDAVAIGFRMEGVRASIARLDASLRSARSRVAFLEKEYARVRALYGDEGAPESSLDEALQTLDQARLGAESMAAEARALEATLGELMDQAARHAVRVPEGWAVTARLVEPGEVIGPGTPLGRAADFHQLVIPLAVDPAELAALRAAAREGGVPVRVDGAEARAAINWINPEFNERTRRTDVELILTDYTRLPSPRRGGAEVTLGLDVRTEGFFIPHGALSSRYENPVVTLKATGRQVEVLVIGEVTGGYRVAETPGLAKGDELLPAANTNPR
jgi:hypothetical protein